MVTRKLKLIQFGLFIWWKIYSEEAGSVYCRGTEVAQYEMGSKINNEKENLQ